MKKTIVFIIIGLILALSIQVVFGEGGDNNREIKIIDALDREVILDGIPERIVVMGNGLPSIVTSMYAFPEASERIVAQPQIQQGAGDLSPIVNSNFDSVTIFENKGTLEEVLRMKPDLVIMKYYIRERDGKPLEELGIPVVYLSFETQETYFQDFTTLGQIFDNVERAEELKNYYIELSNEMNILTAEMNDEDKPSVGFVYYSVKDGEIAFKVPPESWLQTVIVEQAGGNPVWTKSNVSNSWGTVNIEQFYVWQPEVIFVTAYRNDITEVLSTLTSSVEWRVLDAIKNNEIYGFPIDFYYWDQSIPQWGVTMQWMFDILHPGVIDFDFEKETLAFYEFFYRMSEETFYAEIFPLLENNILVSK